MKKLLIIGHTFPEPSTTAAGSRMMQLIGLFQEQNYKITFASTAKNSNKTAALGPLNIEEVSISLNSASFDDFVFRLNPEIVLFDRYITEEQFGWRVMEQCPNALRILDTEDLHFLRKARQEAFSRRANLNLYSEIAKRELASIYRCDLSLIISEFEMELLISTFKISEAILYYLPFLVSPILEEEKRKLPPFDDRTGFMTIGNLLHAPNVDSVKHLKQDLWPIIRAALPKAQLSVYGHYASQQISQLHNPEQGFLINGWAEDVGEVMQAARVCLAPLRFGAGLKGKLFDAMRNGTPSVTTTIGAEGIMGDLPFFGNISDEIAVFAKSSIALYTNEHLWLEASSNGFKILKNRFQKDKFAESLMTMVGILQRNVTQHRQENFMGQLLHQQTTQASKYMSKWIEEKNRKDK